MIPLMRMTIFKSFIQFNNNLQNKVVKVELSALKSTKRPRHSLKASIDGTN